MTAELKGSEGSSGYLSFLPMEIIREVADVYDVDPYLLGAIVFTESGGHQYAVRYESHWSYFHETAVHAKRIGITEESERVLQQMSFGYFQIMGSVLRELGFKGSLVSACDQRTNIVYGTIKLCELLEKYAESIPDALSAYNQGSVRKDKDGKYRNQAYVDRVLNWYSMLSLEGKRIVLYDESTATGQGGDPGE